MRRAGWATGALLAGLLAAGCGEVSVVQGVSEPEANRALGALDHAGLAARKDPDEESAAGGDRPTFHIAVGRDDAARAAEVLAAQELPRREQPGFVETYGARSLVQGAAEERARAAQAIAGELARSIEAIDGVLAARVHVALTDERDLALDGAAPPRPTASVLVKFSGDHAPYDDAALRRLVAGAVQGMRADDVAVVGVARAPSPAAPGGGVAWVGPFAVARRSAAGLREALVALLVTNVALGATVLWLVVRRRRELRQRSAGG